MYHHLDFVIENLSEDKAEDLLDLIVDFCELNGAYAGGTIWSATDADFVYPGYRVVDFLTRALIRFGKFLAKVRHEA